MNNIIVNIQEENSIIRNYFKNKDLVSVEELLGAIEDLKLEIERLNEQMENMDQYYKDNYRRISEHEYYGVSRKDFICE